MNFLKRAILPIVIIIFGIAAAAGIGAMAPKAAQSAPVGKVPPVSVLAVAPLNVPATVTSTGIVSAAQQVSVMPQVSGQVVMVSEDLIPGGRFSKGDQLLRVDPRDYRLAVNQTKSQVRASELELNIEEQRQGVAAREWELLGNKGDASQLVLRKPQLGVAQVSLEAAKSALGAAQLNLERTGLYAPFNSMVVMESVDMGQVVGPSTQVATLIGTDRFWVTVSLPVQELRLLKIPGVNAPKDERGSSATVIQELGDGSAIKREAHILRLSGQLDPQTRRAQLILAIDNPLEGPSGILPMLPGAYVTVEMKGPEVDGVFQIPRAAVYQGNKVWIADQDNKLRTKSISTQWGTDDDLFVTGELAPGDKVITSPLSTPIAGAQVDPQPTKG